MDLSYLFIFLRKHRIDTRTRREKVHRRNEAFDGQIEGTTDAYLTWYSSLGDAGLANDNPVPSSCEFQEHYSVEVLDVYGKRVSLVILSSSLMKIKPLVSGRLLCG